MRKRLLNRHNFSVSKSGYSTAADRLIRTNPRQVPQRRRFGCILGMLAESKIESVN
jgi:hypothetical protein